MSKVFLSIKVLLRNKFFMMAVIIIVIGSVYWGIESLMNNYGDKDVIIQEDDKNIDESDNEIAKTDESTNKDFENQDGSTSKEFENEEGSQDGESIQQENVAEGENFSEDGSDSKFGKEKDVNKIHIYVTGEVNNCGVVLLDEGSRIIDAINAAGGITSNANISKINLVYVLDDGMKVNVPNDNDLKNNPNFKYVTLGSGDDSNDSINNMKITGSEYDSNNSSSKYNSTISVVNINYATQTELETLPGIGPSLALKIINYRKENGLFNSIDEIKNVSGIGDSKFNEIKNYIKV